MGGMHQGVVRGAGAGLIDSVVEGEHQAARRARPLVASSPPSARLPARLASALALGVWRAAGADKRSPVRYADQPLPLSLKLRE